MDGHVLVTGASGFLASHTIPLLLAAGYTVTGVDRRRCTLPPHPAFTFVHKNISTLTSLAGVDSVIHLAFATNIPRSIADPVRTTHNNIYLGVRLLELARAAGVRVFIFPSTASLYGDQPVPWHEDLPVRPAEPYSLQKHAIEQFCQYYAAKAHVPAVIFRLFQVFGENQRADTALAKFFRCKKENKPIPITQTTAQAGFCSARRDFIYAGDVARAWMATLASTSIPAGETINIATGTTYSIEEIAKLISDKIEFIPRRGFESDIHCADISKALKLLDWRPQVDIKEWLKTYVPRL